MTKAEKEIIFNYYQKASDTTGIERNSEQYRTKQEIETILYMLIEDLNIDNDYNKWYERGGA